MAGFLHLQVNIKLKFWVSLDVCPEKLADQPPANASDLRTIKFEFINEVRKDFVVHEILEGNFYNTITKAELPISNTQQ